MSNRKEITTDLSKRLERYINPHNDPRIYSAKEVTFDYGTSSQIRVDYMKFKPKNNTISGIEKGCFYCYEIKSCVEDFNSKNGHNFIGDYNYYVMNRELYEKIKYKLPYFVGVLVPIDDTLEIKRKPKQTDRKRPIYEMLLMMFRSANRDNLKPYKFKVGDKVSINDNQINIRNCGDFRIVSESITIEQPMIGIVSSFLNDECNIAQIKLDNPITHNNGDISNVLVHTNDLLYEE